MNVGRKRILVGSSKNMGTGVNSGSSGCTRCSTWTAPGSRPTWSSARGRIVRQGNKNKLVHLRRLRGQGHVRRQMWKLLASSSTSSTRR